MRTRCRWDISFPPCVPAVAFLALLPDLPGHVHAHCSRQSKKVETVQQLIAQHRGHFLVSLSIGLAAELAGTLPACLSRHGERLAPRSKELPKTASKDLLPASNCLGRLPSRGATSVTHGPASTLRLCYHGRHTCVCYAHASVHRRR